MATEVLRAVADGKTISREVHHDLESFILVIIYVIYKHTVLDPQLDATLRREAAVEFQNYFGGVDLRKIIILRGAAQNHQDKLRACHPPDGFVFYILTMCSRMLVKQNPPRSLGPIPEMFQDDSSEAELTTPTFISYEALEKMLQRALKVLLQVGI